MSWNSPSAIEEYFAATLEEFFEIVIRLGNTTEQLNNIKGIRPLWFRGHRIHTWSLIPSLMRGKSMEHLNKNHTYSEFHAEEEARYHYFRAKVNHIINTDPVSRIEWQEIMQHHSVQTRLMDWSESAIKALLFALEPLLDAEDSLDLRDKRSSMTPVIWILNPQRLNEHVYNVLCTKWNNEYPYIKAVLRDLIEEDKEILTLSYKLGEELSQHPSTYSGESHLFSLDRMLSLSTMESQRTINQSRILQLLRRYEFNPYHYMLLRYYSDGFPVPAEGASGVQSLPPLAIVHPYHSKRIQAQHGVFTAVPSYYLSDYSSTLKKCGVDLRAMEMQTEIADCLHKIRITRPHVVAKQLLLSGERRTALYPDLEQYAKDIEATKYSI